MTFYQVMTRVSEEKVPPAFAGIHISGPNAHKTSVVILRGDLTRGGGALFQVYDRIGSTSRRFSEDRLVEIMQVEGPFREVLVDCPLSVPPCVACLRPVCPGVNACEDISVGYMLSLSRGPDRKAKRPINPQTQRMWDVLQTPLSGNEPLEPTYSANMAPLVVRARTLQRRLNSLSPVIELKETSVPHSLRLLCQHLGIENRCGDEYKKFGVGRQRRQALFNAIEGAGWLKKTGNLALKEKILSSVENFQAFITSLVAALLFSGKCQNAMKAHTGKDGWVFLPNFDS